MKVKIRKFFCTGYFVEAFNTYPGQLQEFQQQQEGLWGHVGQEHRKLYGK